MPKISVIVPVYKVEQYLDRCVGSILAQTFTDFELILVDDGSPDNCPKMCDDWTKKDNRITVIHKPNGGLSDARNAGIDWTFANSDSEWLTFIDSDDWICKKYLETLYNCAVKNEVNVSICGFVHTDGREPIVDEEILETLISPEELYVKNDTNFTIACAKLFKKECFSEIRYPVGKLHEDEFTTYKILMPLKSVSYIQTPLYFYYQNQGGITHNVSCKKIYDLLKVSSEQLEYFQHNGHKRALNRSIWAFMWTISSQIRKAELCNNNKSEVKKLKHKFKKYLCKCRKYGSIDFSKCAGVYEHLYPKRMYIYWTVKGALKKLKECFKI